MWSRHCAGVRRAARRAARDARGRSRARAGAWPRSDRAARTLRRDRGDACRRRDPRARAPSRRSGRNGSPETAARRRTRRPRRDAHAAPARPRLRVAAAADAAARDAAQLRRAPQARPGSRIRATPTSRSIAISCASKSCRASRGAGPKPRRASRRARCGRAPRPISSTTKPSARSRACRGSIRRRCVFANGSRCRTRCAIRCCGAGCAASRCRSRRSFRSPSSCASSAKPARIASRACAGPASRCAAIAICCTRCRRCSCRRSTGAPSSPASRSRCRPTCGHAAARRARRRCARRRVWPSLRYVRFRRGGESLRLHGGAHTRELRDLLQEAGVPPWQRSRLPLVFDAGGALLAVGDLWVSEAGRGTLRARRCAARMDHGSLIGPRCRDLMRPDRSSRLICA